MKWPLRRSGPARSGPVAQADNRINPVAPYGPPAYPPMVPRAAPDRFAAPGAVAQWLVQDAPVQLLGDPTRERVGGPSAVALSHPHPEPREYHRVLRTWAYARWRPIVGLLLMPVGIFVMSIVFVPLLLVALYIQDGELNFDDNVLADITPATLLYLNLSLAALMVWTALLMRVLHHLRLRWSTSVVPKMRWGFLAACTGAAVVAMAASVAVSLALPGLDSLTGAEELAPVTGTTIALIVIVALTTPLQCAGEEYAFRGYLMQALGALFERKWLVIVVSALLFAVAHLQFSPPVFFDRFAFGVVAAWLVIRTGGLESALALHVLNNYVAFGAAIAYGTLQGALEPTDVSWWNMVVSLTQSVVFALLVVYIAKRMNVQRASRPPASAAPQAVSAGSEVVAGGQA